MVSPRILLSLFVKGKAPSVSPEVHATSDHTLWVHIPVRRGIRLEKPTVALIGDMTPRTGMQPVSR